MVCIYVIADVSGVQGVTWQLTGGVVKNIIPAIASTNAIIAAACALETLKLITMCSTGINNYMMWAFTQSPCFTIAYLLAHPSFSVLSVLLCLSWKNHSLSFRAPLAEEVPCAGMWERMGCTLTQWPMSAMLPALCAAHQCPLRSRPRTLCSRFG